MPLISTLVDDFTLDALSILWPLSYGTHSVAGGQARLVCDTSYNAISSAASYTLAGSHIQVRLIPPDRNGALISAYIEMMVESTTAGTDLTISINSVTGQLTCSNRIAYTDGAAVSQTYDPKLHRYVRIRETGGTVFWERSADRSSWTVMRSSATPAWVAAATTAKLTVQAHRDDGLPNTAAVDDINIPAPAAGFPTTPLPVQVLLAPGGDPVSASLRTWTDVTNDWRVRDEIGIDIGRSDEAGRVDASKIDLTLDDRSGDYSPRNPSGQWYGQLRRNTPAQIRLARITDTFARTASASGWGASSSGHAWIAVSPAVWTTTGTQGIITPSATNIFYTNFIAGTPDTEVLYSMSMASLPTGASWITAAMLRHTSGATHYQVRLEITTTGAVVVSVSRRLADVFSPLASSSAGTYAAGEKWWLRTRAEGPYLMARAWKDGTTEPATWQAVAQDGQLNGTNVGVIGMRSSGNTGPASATIEHFSATAILSTGTIAELPVRWDMTATNCTAPITATGVLRRLGQGASALRSPIYRQLSAQPTAAYWPLEDGSDAISASSASPSGVPAAATQAELGNSDCPPGASASVALTTAGASQISGRVTTWPVPQDGYAVMCYLRFPTLPATQVPTIEIAASGRVVRWVISMGATSLDTRGYDSAGAVVATAGTTYGTIDPTRWWAVQLEAQEVGGNTNWALIWHQVGSTSFVSQSGSYAGAADRVGAVTVTAPTNGTLVSHLWAGDDLLPFVDSTFQQVSNGFAGETAAARVVRLGREEGVPVGAVAGESSAMGAQRTGTLLDLLRQCEDTDQGVLYEQAGHLMYLPRGARLNRPVSLALDMAAGHLSAPPEPIDDDQNTRNDITVSRPGGGSARALDETSIAQIGRYDTSIDANLASDAALADHAFWRLRLGTANELRWPVVEIDLARNVSLVDLVLKLAPGTRITIASPPSALAGEVIDLIVEGIKHKIGIFSWWVTLNCTPARPWDVAVLDEDATRLDADSSTVATAINATSTSLVVSNNGAASSTWAPTSTMPGEVPFLIQVGGEHMRVTSVSNLAGTQQTLTVARSVNGVSKAHPVGTPAALAYPSYIGL